MKNRTRTKLFCIVIFFIVFGLASRMPLPLPTIFSAFAGDVLWAAMVYFLFALFFPKWKLMKVALVTIVVAFLIEFSQLLQWDWLVYARTTPLRYILGQGFLGSDLLCYIGGTLSAFAMDKNMFDKKDI